MQQRLDELIRRFLIATCGQVELEYLFTARNPSELAERRSNRRQALDYVDTTEADFERAADVLQLLANRGLHRAANVADLVIAAVAERTGLTVLHYDADFECIAAVTGQAMEWVVPRGAA